ncbi:MAG: NADH-quinone oxidoreductase subunit J [candidate division KSB1 bacterium]|nr:NADH-quinone oxidoreductase subunit J [candidate division KSB1 bacterium]
MTAGLFYVLAALAVLGGIVLVSHRNPVYSALSLIVSMFSLAGLFALQNAQFLAVVQVLVYAGAIMVLFLFVIMLINVRVETRLPRRFTGQAGIAIALVVILALELGQLVAAVPRFSAAPVTEMDPGRVGGAETLARVLFTQYLLPFELASFLLLVAIVGGVYFGKRRLP